jgi:hypothetical protein
VAVARVSRAALAVLKWNGDIVCMDIFLDHIGYIGITLLAGMAIGWKTYPMYRRLIARLHGEDRGEIRVPTDRDRPRR